MIAEAPAVGSKKRRIRKRVYIITHDKQRTFTAKRRKEMAGWEEQQEGKEIAKAQNSDAKNVEVEKKGEK